MMVLLLWFTFLIISPIYGNPESWQPLIQINSTFVHPKENYTLFSSSLDPPATTTESPSARTEFGLESTRDYGFGGYDDEDGYVYSHTVSRVRNPLDLTALLGILSLASLLGTALYALLQTPNGSRTLSNFDPLGIRDDLERSFQLPQFFSKACDLVMEKLGG